MSTVRQVKDHVKEVKDHVKQVKDHVRHVKDNAVAFKTRCNAAATLTVQRLMQH